MSKYKLKISSSRYKDLLEARLAPIPAIAYYADYYDLSIFQNQLYIGIYDITYSVYGQVLIANRDYGEWYKEI